MTGAHGKGPDMPREPARSLAWVPISVLVAVVAMLVVAGRIAHPLPGALFEARTIVTGTRAETRMPALPDLLTEVLVKLSGDPGIVEDPRLAAATSAAGSLLAGHDYRDRMEGIAVHDDQGTYDRPYVLRAAFAPGPVGAILKQLDRSPWRAPRPLVMALVVVEKHGKARLMLADDEAGEEISGQREAIDETAARYGLSLALPRAGAAAAIGLDGGSAALSDLEAALRLARRLGGEAALVGRLRWADEGGWRGGWMLVAPGIHRSWETARGNSGDAIRSGLRTTLSLLSGHGMPAADPAE
ncbi:MAG: DUF2066 domain-containing protein [Hyphomicrobiaceae bacterium]